jgi:hypothetical protein
MVEFGFAHFSGTTNEERRSGHSFWLYNPQAWTMVAKPKYDSHLMHASWQKSETRKLLEIRTL